MVMEVAEVRTPGIGVAHNLRAVKVVVHREALRFLDDRSRMISTLIQPVLWLFVLGTGFGTLVQGAIPGIDYRTFIYPGMISMTVMTTAMFSAGSIVWDREYGFLREMLVAPVSRGAIVTGKCLGGAMVATLQGVVVLALAGLVGVPYDPVLMVSLLLMMFLTAFTVTAFGVLVAAKMKGITAFFAIVQMVMMPMLFLSGAMFPLANLPAWLHILTTINPLTYAVDPLRQSVFSHLDLPAEVSAVLNPGVQWAGWQVPVALELGLVAVTGLILLMAAVARFRKGD
ncbi:ABC transporter permease [Sinosporangium siamense]|uniref:Transport permease protein n=1 Tax=Sinosporangium siamense TaxID=1367973 RepID=A0A919REA0_9ACTN|nr:ABC transporter permease [Sinosporangium siamense]GII92278.1 transport permease protein [Sinosporangium siamense]